MTTPPSAQPDEPLLDVIADPGIESPETPDPRRGRARMLLKGTLWQAVGQFVPLVINLGLTPYIIKGLSGQVYAVFLLVSALQAFMGAVDGGIGPSANRYFSVYAGRDDREATTRLLTTLGLIVAALSVVAFGFFYLLSPAIIAFFPVTRVDPDGAVFLLRTMVVLIAINQVRGLFAFVLFANHRFAVTTVVGLVGYAVYVAGLVWTIETGRGLTGIAWMFMLQQGMATFAIIPSACRFLTRRGIGLVPRETLRDFFGYSWKAQLSSLMDVAANEGDTIIVSRLRAAQFAGFGPGAAFAQQLRMVPMNAYGPMLALIGRTVGAEGERGALPSFEKVQRPWVIAVTGWVAVGAPAAFFGVNAWLHAALVDVIPNDPHLPGIVASVLLVGHLFSLFAIVQIIWCLSCGRSDIELQYGIIALVLNLLGTIALIIPFGVVGSVVATAISQLVSAVALGAIMRRNLAVVPSSTFAHIPVLPAVTAAVLSGLCCWGLSLLVPRVVPYGGVGLITVGIGAAPALVVYALWALGPEQLRTMLASRFPRFAR